ncbi:MAG: hypothetical protein KDJ36_14950, partial [Hyphomicrobiaceae bacterium]|nr:hypothetical protein [Hyphomicrobiaceae bacterium]
MAEATFTSFTAQIEPVVTPRPTAVPVSAQPFAAASAGNTATSVTYRLVTSVEAIRALEPEWTALYRRSARPAQAFQQFHRLSAWLTAFADTRGADQPIVAIGHRNGHAVVIAPLAISRRQGLRVLTWMGEPAVQYGSILVDQVSDAVDLCSDVIDFAISETRPDLAHLRRVRTDFGLNASLAAEGFSVIERDAAPYLDFADKLTAEDYETRYPNKARKNRRRLLRRLEEQHTV